MVGGGPAAAGRSPYLCRHNNALEDSNRRPRWYKPVVFLLISGRPQRSTPRARLIVRRWRSAIISSALSIATARWTVRN